MRLFELAAPTLYLCTSTPQKEGEVVSLDEPICWLGAEIETAIDAQRPADRLPRARSIMLSEQPTGAQYTYIVEPEGNLDRQHTGWIKKLAEADPSQEGVMAHYAIGYWSNKECPEARNEPWEYRARAVRILDRIGGAGRV